jgi:hypothetical protein
LEGRSGKVTWGTLVNFHPGDTVTLWGFDPVNSSEYWDGAAGITGYTGPTLRASIGGGAVTTSVTFADMPAEQARLIITTGDIQGTPYLSIVSPA